MVGEGFTEWNNVKRAEPLFDNHYQPHVPVSPLGYYDLSNVSYQIYQANLAKKYLLNGFCYYYYWFNGKKLLEKPIANMLRTPKVGLDFCICWANGDWTRAWYGQSKEILISQTYTKESAESFARDILCYLADERYIHINGRPLLLIYQVEEIDNPQFIETIRNTILKELGKDVCIARVEALDWDTPPQLYGCDISVEFAPDWRMLGPLVNNGIKPRQVLYTNTIKNMISKPHPGYKRLRCVFPMWDNTPRYKLAAMVIENNSLAHFKLFVDKTLEYIDHHSLNDDEKILFINGWNEWGEGCHLEPDKRFGTGWLEVLKSSLAPYV